MVSGTRNSASFKSLYKICRYMELRVHIGRNVTW
ncbi:unnamed protein product [Schistosoma curassoni]|uniref:Glyceraldehyde-3-phosphate dehydrogenase n=1 Tax=Schistosoma curassoni TaxID=6186 RepID=A0A183L755_9TREM|nr:unnamed protein product [Schistosoma curassoni]